MMRLWIDHTGLHSAGCALRRGARGELDVRGLLQLATILIFADEVLLSSFESDDVAGRSSEILRHLYELGVPPSAIGMSEETEGTYKRACADTAKRISTRLADTFQVNETGILGLEPSDLPARVEAEQPAFVHLSAPIVSAEELKEVEAGAFETKSAGAVNYLVAISPELRAGVRALAGSPGWSDTSAYQLNAYLRFHLNASLAEHRDATYTPAIARARLNRRRNASIVGRLMERVDEVVKRLGDIPLHTPSIAQALVTKGGAHPEGVITQALYYRERAAGLRSHLDTALAGIDSESGEGRYEIDRVSRKLADDVARELGLTPASGLGEAVDVLFVLGLPVPEVSGAKVLQWIKEHWGARRSSVLTELSKEYLGTLDPIEEYGALVRNCHRQNG